MVESRCHCQQPRHGTHFLQHDSNFSHDVVCGGGLGGCEGMEVCDWSNSYNLSLAVTSSGTLSDVRVAMSLQRVHVL